MMEPNVALTDAVGKNHRRAGANPRIASLVPSITELLFALDLGQFVVARTAYCVHPADRVATVPAVGGTKKIKHRALRELAPTHVVLNIDENTREMARRLEEYVPNLVITHPLAPEDNIPLYRLLGGVFNRAEQAERLVAGFRAAMARLQDNRAGRSARKVLYLIWKRPWMAVSPDTYIARTLAAAGLYTWPTEPAPRYPAIAPEHVPQDLDCVLFSTEPYSFGAADLEEFGRLCGIEPQRLRMIDGEMTSWYGSRAVEGLDYLAGFVESIDGPRA